MDWMIPDRDEEGAAVELKLPEKLPTAFMCNCDEAAFRLVRALKLRNLSVPDDVSVAGFDDDIYAKLCEPALTTVAVDMEEVGRVAVGSIVRMHGDAGAGNGEVYRIPGKMVIRDSVREMRGE